MTSSGGRKRRVKGFFIVWWRLWGVQQTRPWWRRIYWTTVCWNRFNRGRDFVS